MPSFKMKFSGVTILQGVEFSIFPIDFEWALQQCSATALPVTVIAYIFLEPVLSQIWHANVVVNMFVNMFDWSDWFPT